MGLLLAEPPSVSSWSGHSCCTHPECSRLRDKCWCGHWFMMQWVAPRHISIMIMADRMETCLIGCAYLVSSSQHGDVYEYRFLLSMKHCVDGSALREKLFSKLGLKNRSWSGYEQVECFIRPFNCCTRMLRQDAPNWISSIHKGDVVFGDRDLERMLEREVLHNNVPLCLDTEV